MTSHRSGWILALLMLGALVAVPLRVRATPVEESTAREIAGAFLESPAAVAQSRGACEGVASSAEPAARRPAVVACRSLIADGRTLAHVLRLEPCGYVVVPGDDGLPPVLAYSFEADYPVEGRVGDPLIDLVVADVRSRLAALPMIDPSIRAAWRRGWIELARGEVRSAERFEQWPPAGSTPTGGWLLTNWTQNAPYNNLCPLDLAHGGVRSVAGCPAVAMAMILNYHATVQETSFDTGDRYFHNYAGNAYWIPDAAVQYGFPSFPTLNACLETLTLHWDEETPLTNTDKAALVFACGTAARQVYSAAGSGTFGVDQAFTAYQRFSFAACRLADETDPNLYLDLATQMQNAWPAHLAVVDPGWTMGHNLVIDGYNSDGYFHLNFGWGGSYNGWYLLPEGIPYGLTVIEGVILDILPAATATPDLDEASVSSVLRSDPNPFGPRVDVSFVAPQQGHARLGIYDVAGRLQALVLDEDVEKGMHASRWTSGSLPAGVYWLRLDFGGRSRTKRLVLAR